MSKVLYIKASPKREDESRTFRISGEFIKAYKEYNKEDEIITLNLYDERIGFLTRDNLQMLNSNPSMCKGNPIIKYAYEFAEADKYVIAAPFWNLSFPAILYAYINYVCVSGITFKYTEKGAVGLCEGKKALHIVTRGGDYSFGEAAESEMGDRYLRKIFDFLGIKDFSTIVAQGLDVKGVDKESILGVAMERARNEARRF